MKTIFQSHGVRSFAPLLLAALLLVAIAAQSRLAHREVEMLPETKFSYLPNIATARLLTPGHQITTGRLWWIRAATYFGGETLAGRDARWMIHLSSLSATLDPQFRWPYVIVGTSAVDELSRSDIDLLFRGIQALPTDIHLHLFLAMRLVEKEGDYAAATQVLNRVADLSDAPEFLVGMRNTYSKNQNDLPQALAIYLGEWENSRNNPGLAKAVLNRLERMAIIKKNSHSTLTHKEIKALGEQLQSGQLAPQQYYSIVLDRALPPPPLVEETLPTSLISEFQQGEQQL